MSIKVGILSEEISLRLTEERVRVGFSQADMARKLGVTRETMRKWEAGLSMVSSEALSSAFQLGVDVQYVLTGVRAAPRQDAGTAVVSGPISSGIGIVMQGANAQIVNTTKHVTQTKAVVNPGQEHITDAQAATLTALVQQIVDTEAKLKKSPSGHRSVWAALNRHCGVPQYRLIPADRFDKARLYLNTWMGRLNSMASAPVKDGDTWRKRHYAYIKINTKVPEEQAALERYMIENFSGTKLTALANDELERVYRYVAGRRARRSSHR